LCWTSVNAYLDSNIYISYLLGQGHEELIGKVLKRGIGCAFTVVASPIVFAETGMRCMGRGDMLLKKTLDDFKKAGKITLVRNEMEIDLEASRLDEETGGVFGLNDFAHVLLASKYADVFVTEDRALRRTASRFVRTASLSEFAEEVFQTHPP
jgi:PIN domain